MIYFNSCYLAKLYRMESDSARVRAYAEASDGLACCATGRGEVVATFHRHFREKRRDTASSDSSRFRSKPISMPGCGLRCP